MTGAELKEKRLARGWTQAQLSEVSGVSAQVISNAEKGKNISPASKGYLLIALAGEREPKPHRPRGFAAMDPEQARRICALGGRTAARAGKGHRYTADTARQAGQKGGISVARNRQHMADIGRRGGERRAQITARKGINQEHA